MHVDVIDADEVEWLRNEKKAVASEIVAEWKAKVQEVLQVLDDLDEDFDMMDLGRCAKAINSSRNFVKFELLNRTAGLVDDKTAKQMAEHIIDMPRLEMNCFSIRKDAERGTISFYLGHCGRKGTAAARAL